MKMRLTVLCALLLMLVVLSLSPAFACAPGDLDSRCSVWRFPQLSATPISVVLAGAKNIPRGDSPESALEVKDTWQTLEPGASIWYQTTYSESFRVLEFWLETNRPDATNLSIFSPGQREGLSSATKPIGRGTHGKSDPDNIIRWRAGYAKPGVWYLLITNILSVPVSYRLNHNQSTTETKQCFGYWEYIGKDYVYWLDCSGRGH